jgi:hypothetical protein
MLAPLGFAALMLRASLAGSGIPSYRDQSDFFYPAHRYTAERLRHREIPLWNPLSGNGESWVGNGQSEVFYPPALLFLLRDGALASGLFLLVHFTIAYLGMIWFLRDRGSTRPAAVFGASVFAVSGPAVSFSCYWNHFAGFAWLPLAAAAAAAGLRTRRQRAGFSAALALCVLAGSPEAALVTTAISAALFWQRKRSQVRLIPETGDVHVPRASFYGAAFGLSAALSAVVWIPLADTLRRAAPRGSSLAGPVDFRQLLSIASAPSLSATPWYPTGTGYLQTLYLGLPLLALAAAAILLPESGRQHLAWIGVALAGVALALAPLPLPFRYPSKLLYLALFALSILAAEGADALRFDSPGPRRLAVLAALLGAALATGLFLCRTPAERATALFFGAFAAASGLSLGKSPRALLSGFAAAALSAHFFFALSPLFRTADASAFVAPPKHAHGKVLTSQDGYLSGWSSLVLPDENARVRRQIDSIEGYSNLPFGIAKARTASAIPTREQAAFDGALEGRTELTRPAALAGCGEVRFPRGQEVGRVVVSSTLSGATFFFGERESKGLAEGLSAAVDGSADFRRVLQVERPAGISGGSQLAVTSVLASTPEATEMRVSVDRPAWLYRAQAWDPWWRAEIDGKAAPIVHADGVFSALVVPAGAHVIVWKYRPWPFYAGAAISGIALLFTVGLAAAGEPAGRRR